MRWMLDTDTCIAFMNRERKQPSQRSESKALGDVGISSIILAELYAGVAKSEQYLQTSDNLRRFLIAVDIVPFDEPAAAVYGAIRARLELMP